MKIRVVDLEFKHISLPGIVVNIIKTTNYTENTQNIIIKMELFPRKDIIKMVIELENSKDIMIMDNYGKYIIMLTTN